MTPTTLAETILRDVRRHTIRLYVDDLPCLLETDVLAALTAALDPAMSERAVRTAEALRNIGPMLDLRLSGATIIYDLLAQNAALRAERDALDRQLSNVSFDAECEAEDKRDAAYGAAEWQRRAETAEAQIAALTARVEGLTGALEFYADESAYETQYERLPCDCCTDIYEPINRDKGSAARAALSATTEEGK